MSVAMSLVPEEPANFIVVVSEVFEGIPVHAIRMPDRRKLVRFASIEPRMSRSAKAIGEMLARAEFHTVKIDGVLCREQFIPRDVFLGAVLGDERFEPFRRFVVSLLEQLEDQGLVVNPTHADDPSVKLWSAGLKTALDVAELKRQTQEISQRQGHLEHAHLQLTGEVVDARRVADYAVDAISNGEFLFAVPWLNIHGVRIPDEMNGRVGVEIKAIALECCDYDADCRPKKPHRGYATHVYPPLVMEKAGRVWIERNRDIPKRREWFR